MVGSLHALETDAVDRMGVKPGAFITPRQPFDTRGIHDHTHRGPGSFIPDLRALLDPVFALRQGLSGEVSFGCRLEDLRNGRIAGLRVI